jgi:hypothetical protein
MNLQLPAENDQFNTLPISLACYFLIQISCHPTNAVGGHSMFIPTLEQFCHIIMARTSYIP